MVAYGKCKCGLTPTMKGRIVCRRLAGDTRNGKLHQVSLGGATGLSSEK